MEKGFKDIVKDLNRENLYDKIQELKKEGYYTDLITEISPKTIIPDFVSPKLLLFTIKPEALYQPSNDANKNCFSSAAIIQFFNAIGGEILDPTYQYIKRPPSYDAAKKPINENEWQYIAGIRWMTIFGIKPSNDKYIKESILIKDRITNTNTDVTKRKDHQKNMTKTLARVIRTYCFPHSPFPKEAVLKKGVIVLMTEFDKTTTNLAMRDFIEKKEMESFGFFSQKENTPMPIESVVNNITNTGIPSEYEDDDIEDYGEEDGPNESVVVVEEHKKDNPEIISLKESIYKYGRLLEWTDSQIISAGLNQGCDFETGDKVDFITYRDFLKMCYEDKVAEEKNKKAKEEQQNKTKTEEKKTDPVTATGEQKKESESTPELGKADINKDISVNAHGTWLYKGMEFDKLDPLQVTAFRSQMNAIRTQFFTAYKESKVEGQENSLKLFNASIMPELMLLPDRFILELYNYVLKQFKYKIEITNDYNQDIINIFNSDESQEKLALGHKVSQAIISTIKSKTLSGLTNTNNIKERFLRIEESAKQKKEG
jgi:hypothetical protein